LSKNARKHKTMGGIPASVSVKPLEILWFTLDCRIFSIRLTKNKIPDARTNATRNATRIYEYNILSFPKTSILKKSVRI